MQGTGSPGTALAPDGGGSRAERRPQGGAASERLHLLVGLAGGRQETAARAFWTHPRLVDAFPEYQFRLHCCGRAITGLIEAAIARSRELAPRCPVAARLVPYLALHLQEEAGHDEWLLADMEALGTPRETVLGRIPSGDAAALIGTFYYWIMYAHPVAILALFFVVEAHPPKTETLDEIIASTGLPREALGTFYKHAVIDERHGAEVLQLLDELPLTPPQLDLLGTSTLTALAHLTTFMERLVQFADRIELSPERA